MEIRLYYRGTLKSNAGVRDKHVLRQHFHLQLREAWSLPPLIYERGFLNDPPQPTVSAYTPSSSLPTIIQNIGDFRFAPLICDKLKLLAELDILLLRPQEPGSIVMSGGDIDNRLKTLFDALRVPRDPSDRQGLSPAEGEDPFFCLLEDDSLITAVRLETDRLLEPSLDRNEVLLVIRVKTKIAYSIIMNIPFA